MQINWVTTRRRRRRRCHCQFERSRVNFESDKQDGWQDGGGRSCLQSVFQFYFALYILHKSNTNTCYDCYMLYMYIVLHFQLSSRRCNWILDKSKSETAQNDAKTAQETGNGSAKKRWPKKAIGFLSVSLTPLCRSLADFAVTKSQSTNVI